MSESDVQDPRIHEQRLAALWAHAYASETLVTTIHALYAHEINVGLQTFYDGGCDVWLGDDMNGRRVSETFDRDSFAEIAGWLVKTAEGYYPLLRQSRLRMSMVHG